jgi:hypothetical protein
MQESAAKKVVRVPISSSTSMPALFAAHERSGGFDGKPDAEL